MCTDRDVGEPGSASDQGSHRVRDQYLASLGFVTYPRGHGDRESDDITILVGDLTGVDTDAHSDLATIIGLTVVERHAFLDTLPCDDRIDGGVEDCKGTVAEVLDEPTTSGGQCVADDPVMLDADLVCLVITEPFTHTRRTDQVREHHCC
jgi:hypothetical protein